MKSSPEERLALRPELEVLVSLISNSEDLDMKSSPFEVSSSPVVKERILRLTDPTNFGDGLWMR